MNNRPSPLSNAMKESNAMAARKPAHQGSKRGSGKGTSSGATPQQKQRRQRQRGGSAAQQGKAATPTKRPSRPATPRQVIARASGKRVVLTVRDSLYMDDGSTHEVIGVVEKGVSPWTPWVLRMDDGSTMAIMDVFKGKAVLSPWIVEMSLT